MLDTVNIHISRCVACRIMESAYTTNNSNCDNNKYAKLTAVFVGELAIQIICVADLHDLKPAIVRLRVEPRLLRVRSDRIVPTAEFF